MHCYAQINESNQCTSVSQLSGPVALPELIPIPADDPDYIGRRYENGVWGDRPAPEDPPTDRISILESENADLKARLSITEEAVLELAAIIGGA